MTDKRDSCDTPDPLRHLPGRVIVEQDTDDLLDHLAGEITYRLRHSAGATGQAHLALSGGSTPMPLYQRLLIDPRFRGLPWGYTHVWLVDERCVPADDQQSNFGAIKRQLLDHVPVRPEAVHPVPVAQPDGDMAYEIALRQALADRAGRLDVVLLGMGADGHTASLFPGSPAVSQADRLVVFNDGPTVAPPRPRITMTYPLLNAAQWIGVLITGQNKHAAIQRVGLARQPEVDRLPITGIKPQPVGEEPAGELYWYLDAGAAHGVAGD
jgi:6-phosphogluconolactonase